MAKTKITNRHRPALIQDLKIGLKYIHIISDFLSDKEKKDYFYIYKIETQGQKQMTDNEYLTYKQNLKQWTKQKQIWIKD